MSRRILYIHDNGATAALFHRVFTTFAEARDFKVTSDPSHSVVATVYFTETSTPPRISNEIPIAVCSVSEGLSDSLWEQIKHFNIIHYSTVPKEPSHLMRWLDDFWQALTEKANHSSRCPKRLTVTKLVVEKWGDFTVYEADVVGHQLLTHPDYPRPSYLLTFDYKDAPIEYTVGDHVVIIPENKDANVERLINRLGADRHAVYTVVDEESGHSYTASAYDIFKRRLGIQSLASRKWLAMMALMTDDAEEAGRLNELATNMNKDSPYAASIRNNFSFVDVLEKFSSLKLTIEEAISVIPPMRPRMYSCSSSPLRAPHQVQLSFTLVSYPTADGAYFEGTNTSYMKSLKVGDKVRMTLEAGMQDPTLNKGGMKYLGVALGSGVAPLRGIAQHFHLSQNDSTILLYYGVRHQSKDFMFGDEFEEYAKTGAVELHTAFSHDQDEFITPATLINQDPERLVKVLVDEPLSKFYYCGPAGPAIESILSAIRSAIEKCRPSVDYDELVRTMKKEKRWHAEAYTPMPDPENPFKL